jgi:hypothetical protein
VHKAAGGIIRVTLELVEERINDILISGDFEFFPRQKLADLEKNLIGIRYNEQDLNDIINLFYQENSVKAPGTLPQDFSKAIRLAVQQI